MVRTEVRTLLRALISASMLSFLACSWEKVRPSTCIPFVVGADVGPEGTVGACRFSILAKSCPFSRRRKGRPDQIVLQPCGRSSPGCKDAFEWVGVF